MTEDDFLVAIAKTDVHVMCKSIFKKDYEVVQKLLYPNPKYTTFLKAKKSGGHRVISQPSRALRVLQRQLLDYLYGITPEFRACAHGFIRGRSIVTNAREHVSLKTQFVLNVDLRDFFPSITFPRVRGAFMAYPYEFSFEVATVLAQLICFQGVLPQGGPTSPFISNLICRGMDKQLVDLARRNRARYSRYCDDITFSFTTRTPDRLPPAICNFDGAALSLGFELTDVILQNGFEVNDNKVRISGIHRRMDVTGLTINQFPNVRRKFVDEIRGAINAWAKHGYVAAENTWQQREYPRQRFSADRPELHRVLFGKILHLKAVRSADDVLYNRLAERYNELVLQQKQVAPTFGRLLPVSPIVRTPAEINGAVFVLEAEATHEPANELIHQRGTAFAFGEFGLLTCDHVLRYALPEEVAHKETLAEPYVHHLPGSKLAVFHPPTQTWWPVEVAALDKYRDIALLRFVGAKPNFLRHFASLGEQGTVAKKGAPVVLLGFPNFHISKKEYSEDDGKIIGMLKRNTFDRVEINVMIRSGNSGGPVVDPRHRVIGMAQMGATQGSGNNECLSLSEIEKWLDGLQITNQI